MKKAKLLLSMLAAALVLPAAQSSAAEAGKRSVVERINHSLEKSRRVRESKKRRSEMEKRERAKAQSQKEQARQGQAVSAPMQEPNR